MFETIFPGNAFIVSVALADLLVSSILIPTSVIVLLAGFDESSMAICRAQWFFAACAFLVTILSLAVSNPIQFQSFILSVCLCLFVTLRSIASRKRFEPFPNDFPFPALVSHTIRVHGYVSALVHLVSCMLSVSWEK